MRPWDCPKGQFVVTLRNGIGAHVPRSAAAIAANDLIVVIINAGAMRRPFFAVRVQLARLQSLARLSSAELSTRRLTSVGRRANLCLLEGRRFVLRGTSGRALLREVRLNPEGANLGHDSVAPSSNVC